VNSGQEVFWIIALLALGAMYLLPTIIAFKRRHMSRVAIAIINIFFGWTIYGWWNALIWACSANWTPRARGY
jgi:hypothetical protein